MFYTDEAINKNAKRIADEINSNFPGRVRDITEDDFIFDDSRSWSFYLPGYLLSLPCRNFGAYRSYLGGGIRGGVCHNGREEEKTIQIGEMFCVALREIEKADNKDLTPDACESWENASGVLL